MKFSEKTIDALKNLSTFNPSIIIEPGNKLRTLSTPRSVVADITIPDEFETSACIYDLSTFLSTISLFENPDVEFTDKFCMISEKSQRVRYRLAAKEMVLGPPSTTPNLPSVDIEFELKWDDLQQVLKGASILGLTDLAFVGEDGVISIKALDSKDDTSDTFGIDIGETDDNFIMVIKTFNLKLLPKDYNVKISSKNISKFTAEDAEYIVALEKSSEYKKGE